MEFVEAIRNLGTDAYKLKIVLILTFGFGFASILGFFSQKIKLSPILGYLLAGYVIGPFSPGFVADLEISEQLAEIGVILMMFGVGLHFKGQDLLEVKNIAIPGAVGQTLAAGIIATILLYTMGWTISAGVVMGMAIGVASTVVLVRVLSDNNLINTPQGHIAVGWLLVEDILTVIALIILPIVADASQNTEMKFENIGVSIISVLVKFLVLSVIIFTLGKKFVTFVFNKVAHTHSHELFTLTILAITFVIASSSAIIFGTSIALGAFLAGMVIGRTDVRHQVSANTFPLRDTFVVIFFMSIGMLFNPQAIVNHFSIFISILAIILIIKPLTALLIVLVLDYPLKTGLIVGIALAQIGEFSFILAEEASKHNILPDIGYDVIVACALISISINPILFKTINWIHSLIGEKTNIPTKDVKFSHITDNTYQAIVIGFGPIGQAVCDTLEEIGYRPLIIDRDVEIVKHLRMVNRHAIFGDAALPNILEAAKIKQSPLLVITTANIDATVIIINIARHLNPNIQILALAELLEYKHLLNNLDVNVICMEEESLEAFNDALWNITELGASKTIK